MEPPRPDFAHDAAPGPAPGAGLAIRLALPADGPAIAALHARAWQWAYKGIVPGDYLAALTERVEQRARWWEDRLSGQDADMHVWVALLGDRLAGFSTTAPSRDDDAPPGTGEIRSIYLEPALAGQGIGRTLFAHAADDLRAQGYRSATLWVLANNHRAIAFYQAAGWRPDGAAKNDERPPGLSGGAGGFVLREIRYRIEL